jgi:hypothetical protein
MTPKTPWRALLAALTLTVTALASAQTAPPRPDPADAKAPTGALVHRGALAAYRSHGAPVPPLGWREANDAVERIGGWRAYAREANAAPTPAASAPGAAK